MKIKLRWKSLDYLALGLSIAVTTFSIIWAWGQTGGEPRIEIESPRGLEIYPLSSNLSLPIPGPLGNTIVRIQDSEVQVESSPCDNKLCIGQGHIHQTGEWIACLPNRVFVRVQGPPRKDGVDAVSF